MIASALPFSTPSQLVAYFRAYPAKLRAKDALNTALYRAELRYKGIESRTPIAQPLSRLFNEQVRLVSALNAKHGDIQRFVIAAVREGVRVGILPPDTLTRLGVGMELLTVVALLAAFITVAGFLFNSSFVADIIRSIAEGNAIETEAIANAAQLDRELKVWEEQVAKTPAGQPVPPPPSRAPSPVPPKDSSLINIDGGVVVGLGALALVLWLGGRKRRSAAE